MVLLIDGVFYTHDQVEGGRKKRSSLRVGGWMKFTACKGERIASQPDNALVACSSHFTLLLYMNDIFCRDVFKDSIISTYNLFEFDFYVNARWQFQSHKSINSRGSWINQIDYSAMRSDFKVLSRVLVHVRGT